MPAKRPDGRAMVAVNRKARHDYFIEDNLEAGIVLTGSEVKSLRLGRASIAEAFAVEIDGDFYLMNSHIPEYAPAARFGHEPRRQRKLLLHRKQVEKLRGTVSIGGMTLIPLAVYFNDRGMAKVELGVARGKKDYDKRETIKQRDWDREKQRLLRKD